MRRYLVLMALGILGIGLMAAVNKIVLADNTIEVQEASFQASFKFGQEARGTAYRTEWYARSSFTDTVGFHTIYLTMPTQLITRTIGADGYISSISTDLTYPRYPRGFRLVSSGTTKRSPRLLVETSWISDCLPGPELLLELHEFPLSDIPWAQITIRNTTLQNLNLYSSTGGALRQRPLVPGEWQTNMSTEESNQITIKSLGQSREESCATISWTLPPPAPLPIPTITPVPSQLITFTLNTGWELFSMPETRRSYRADNLISEMATQGVTVTQVVRWQNGSWDTHLGGFPVNNFLLEPGRAYFLRVTKGGFWRIEH